MSDAPEGTEKFESFDDDVAGWDVDPVTQGPASGIDAADDEWGDQSDGSVDRPGPL
jgi:hypothetical protein